jgi:alpha/beta superfamily hydrolase
MQAMPERALLVLHPHPLHGGTMGNKVVTTVARAANAGGLAVVAFNFRGAGLSEGVWDEGVGELADATAIAQTMIAQGVRSLSVAGFSFGGSMAARLLNVLHAESPDVHLRSLTQIAPAVVNFPVSASDLVDTETLVLFNQDDEIVDPHAMQAYVDDLSLPHVTHPDGGHFYHGQLTRLKADLQSHWHQLGWL